MITPVFIALATVLWLRLCCKIHITVFIALRGFLSLQCCHISIEAHTQMAQIYWHMCFRLSDAHNSWEIKVVLVVSTRRFPCEWQAGWARFKCCLREIINACSELANTLGNPSWNRRVRIDLDNNCANSNLIKFARRVYLIFYIKFAYRFYTFSKLHQFFMFCSCFTARTEWRFNMAEHLGLLSFTDLNSVTCPESFASIKCKI